MTSVNRKKMTRSYIMSIIDLILGIKTYTQITNIFHRYSVYKLKTQVHCNLITTKPNSNLNEIGDHCR